MRTENIMDLVKKGRGLVLLLCAMAALWVPVCAQAASGASIDQAYYDSFRAVFDASFYYNAYPDLQEAIGYDEEALFEHYMEYGVFEGRSGDGAFYLCAYINRYEDLLAAFGADYGAYCRHYVEYGRQEGRSALPEGEDDLLGSYTTYYDTTESRAINVQKAAERIDGVVLQPGETFSFNKTVLPRTRANGYVMGPVFSGGREVQGIGGGICQVSSNLYVAMVLAGIPATEHYHHSLPVDYVPRGLDATISGNSKDLKFVNPYSCAIVIRSSAQDGTLVVSLATCGDL